MYTFLVFTSKFPPNVTNCFFSFNFYISCPDVHVDELGM